MLCLLCRAGEQQKKATGTRLINRSGISGGLLRGDRGRSGRGGGEHLSVCLVSAVCPGLSGCRSGSVLCGQRGGRAPWAERTLLARWMKCVASEPRRLGQPFVWHLLLQLGACSAIGMRPAFHEHGKEALDSTAFSISAALPTA